MDRPPTEHDLFWLMRNYPVRGLRFQPTEAELIEYLAEHMRGIPVNPNHIPIVDLNTVEPREIPNRCQPCFPGHKQEWYLIHSCCKKYSGSSREDRSTPEGYWKATGRPTNVVNKLGNLVGTRKTLVFYSGRATNRSQNEGKTEWIMHEFRCESAGSVSPNAAGHNTWVICSISNKPAPRAPSPSPGPASPSSGGHSDRSYSPGPPSVTSGGRGDLSEGFPTLAQTDATPPASGGSSPNHVADGTPFRPPHLNLSPASSFGFASPHGLDSARLSRCGAFVHRLPGSTGEGVQSSPPGSLSNNPSFERWGNGLAEIQQLDWDIGIPPLNSDPSQNMDALQFHPQQATTTQLDVQMDVDYLEWGSQW